MTLSLLPSTTCSVSIFDNFFENKIALENFEATVDELTNAHFMKLVLLKSETSHRKSFLNAAQKS